MNIKNKQTIILIILTIVGFFLRLKASLNLDVFADDMLYASQSAGIINAGILSTHSNPPLFFYLTDLAYKIFGHSTFASRFWPLIAGTLLIPLIFILTKKLSQSENVALGTAFFVAFSTFLIRMTFTEQSLLVLFFVTFSLICGLNYTKTSKMFWAFLFGIGFGLATLTKYSAPFFFIAFCVFVAYANEQKLIIKNSLKIKPILVVLGLILILSLPFLAFNYLIYKENGIVDVYFSRIIHLDKTQQLYQGLAGQGESFFGRLIKLDSYSQYNLPFITDPLLTIFALIGVYLLVRRKDKIILPFIAIMVLIPFILQSGGSALQKHFAFMHLFLAIPAGFTFEYIKSKINKKNIKIGFYTLLIVGMLLSLGTTYGTPENLRVKSATSQLKSYINEKVTGSDLIILDSRIYSARNFWLATPNSFITSLQFPEIYNLSVSLSSDRLKQTNVFYVECAIDDCGWGWVHNDQNLNRTSEDLAKIFESNGLLTKSIKAPEHTLQEFFKKADDVEVYKVYYLTINLPPEVISQSKNIQNFYFTPYLYSNMENYIFNYKSTGLGKLLERFALLIIYISIVLTLLVTILVALLLNNERAKFSST